VFLLGFYTLTAKSSAKAELPLNERIALWQHEGGACATGANHDSRATSFSTSVLHGSSAGAAVDCGEVR
jgi:hypothetical protein